MDDQVLEVVHFAEPGPQNTERTLALGRDRLRALQGALPLESEVLALAGTGFGGGGADTAVVVRVAQRWPDWRLLEVLARPRVSPPSEGA